MVRFADTIVTSHTVYVIVLDVAAGRRHRYTVHAISRRGMQLTDVIGRELPLVCARRVVNEHTARIEGITQTLRAVVRLVVRDAGDRQPERRHRMPPALRGAGDAWHAANPLPKARP